MVKVKKQVLTKNSALYNGDSVEILKGIPDGSVGFSIFSPPFCNLYCYSEDDEDMGNSRSPEEFFKHFDYLIAELHRVMMPGRNVSVHCAELPIRKQDMGYIAQYDFPGDLIRHFQDAGFVFHGRCTIWKDPLVLFMRTKLAGLAHKQIVADSTSNRMGNPDYVLTFRKKGDNFKPVAHPRGLVEYHGMRKVPDNVEKYLYSSSWWNESNPYNPGKDKRSHWIWQQYASPVWFDIRQMKVLPHRAAKDEDDEKHICPLQLDVIERCLELWSTPGDVVLSPFAGIGSEVYVAVKNGRKGLGIELKPRYFRQMVRNLEHLQRKQGSGFREGKRGIAP